MTYARALYERFRILIHEAASFGVVGAVGFVVTLGGSDLLYIKAGLGPTTAEVIATLVATAVTYLGNRYWSFRRRTRTNVPREAVTFFVLNGIGIVIQTLCVDFTYYLLGLHGSLVYNISLIFGIGFGTLFRFWSYRKWVWAAPAAGGPPAQAEPAGPDRPPPAVPSGGDPWEVRPPAVAQGADLAPEWYGTNGRYDGYHARERSAWTASPPTRQQ